MMQRRAAAVQQIVGDPTSDERLLDSATFVVLGILVVVTSVSPYMYGKFLVVPIVLVTVLRLLRDRLPDAAIAWTYALVGLGAIGTVQGVIHTNPGALPNVTVYVVEPLLFGLFFGSAMSRSGWEAPLMRSLDFALVAVTVVGVGVYVATISGIHLPAWLVDPAFSFGDLSPGTLRTNYQGFNTLIFLAPYGIWRATVARGLPSLSRVALASIAVLATIISGRRILLLSIPIALVLTWLLSRRRPSRDKSTPRHPESGRWKLLGVGTAIFAAVMIAAVGIARLSAVDAVQRVVAKLTLAIVADPRWEESGAIIDRWARAPFFGYGTGAIVHGYQRSADYPGGAELLRDYPWAFELSYHVVLLDFGLFGLALLLLWGLWILRGLRRGLKTVSDITLAGALICAFISTALAIFSDPYVQKFDGMWMLFIPFGAAVYWSAHDHNPPDLEQGRGRE